MINRWEGCSHRPGRPGIACELHKMRGADSPSKAGTGGKSETGEEGRQWHIQAWLQGYTLWPWEGVSVALEGQHLPPRRPHAEERQRVPWFRGHCRSGSLTNSPG